MIRVSGQSKSRPVEAAGAAEAGGQRINQKLHAAVVKSTFWSESVQNTSGVRSTFGSSDVAKIARGCGETSTCCSENVTKHGQLREHFLKMQMSKKCTPLWRKGHFEVKMLQKHLMVRSTFGSSRCRTKLHATVAKRAFGSENAQNMRCSEHFLKLWCRKIARRCSAKHICKWKCTEYLCFSTLFELQMSKNLSLSKFFSQSISQVVN